MFSGELEIQARRRTLAVLQDEVRRVLDAGRDLTLAYNALLGANANDLQAAIERIRKAEEDVESLRRSLTRELAEIGTMMMNREDLLRTAYNIEEVASYISGIAFKFGQVKPQILKKSGVSEGLRELVEMSVEAIHRLNEIVRALGINPITAIDLANSVQKVERQVDDRYRELIVKALAEVDSAKDLIMLKDIIESVEDLADRCLAASDAITIVALGL
jgi:hypothetical protein